MKYLLSSPYIANYTDPNASWLDYYLQWAASPVCCLADFNIHSSCKSINDTSIDCEQCFSLDSKNRPYPTEFTLFITRFLNEPISETCAQGGKSFQSDIVMGSSNEIRASKFELYFEPLVSQQDTIEAIKTTYQLVDNSPLNVTAFSPFFVYFGQFMDIKVVSTETILLALGKSYINVIRTKM